LRRSGDDIYSANQITDLLAPFPSEQAGTGRRDVALEAVRRLSR
jgi:hypothetical protein